MTQLSSYTPFLIGSGTSKTGLFQYLESWVKPEDAYDVLEDAYINRGRLFKREGQTLLGVLKYCSSEVVGYGTGAAGAYSGTMNTHLPILAGSVTIKTISATPVIETYTDNGSNVLTGDAGGTGTINYLTGAWSINSVITLVNGSPISMDYTFTPSSATNQNKNKSVAALGTGARTRSGTFSKNLPAVAGSVVMTARQSNGTETYTDNGANVLVGSLGGTGTINYTTGAWSLDSGVGHTIVNGSPITISFTGPSTTLTIMGINQWNDESNNTFTLCVEDCRRMSTYDINTQTFDPICTVNETLYILPNATSPSSIFDNGTQGVNPTFPLIAPLSMTFQLIDTLTGNVVTAPGGTTTDDGMGNIIATPYFLNGVGFGTVDYYTGQIQIKVQSGAQALAAGMAINVSFTLQNDYFSGNQSNFFNWTNWEPSTNRIVTAAAVGTETPTQFQQGFLYLTNNVDPITLFNGTDLSRPAFAIKQSNLGLGKNEITKALDVKTFASRLLIVQPTTTIGNGNPDPQSIRWSAQFQPTNTVSDIPGSGGELSAATSDWIKSAKFLKDFIVVSFQNSTWTFRFTGSAFAPFQWFRLNATKTCNAPYGSIEYDEFIKTMGSKGLTYCDGAAVERYDLKIIDQFEDINATSFGQCFGQRFDILNQAWMLYPDATSNATTSTKVLLHNYIEDSWAVFNMPLSCLGLGFGVKDLTWADFTLPWEKEANAWNSYLQQKESLRLLGGNFVGQVLQLNDGPDDNGTSVVMNAWTKKYNPFAKDGLKGNFGYLDVYYTVNPEVTLTFNFFIDNNSASVALTQNIALEGTTGADYGWQRIFINIQASQLQWQIVDNGVTNFEILGQILHASPAGRITQ